MRRAEKYPGLEFFQHGFFKTTDAIKTAVQRFKFFFLYDLCQRCSPGILCPVEGMSRLL
jgi:hypothetical protein